MAVPVRESSNEESDNSFAKPSGLANGDIVEILYWQFHSGSTPASAPTDFSETSGGGQVNAGANGFFECRRYRKVITNAAGEPASYTVTRGSGTNFADGGEIFRISGVDNATPEDATATFGTGVGTTATSGSMDTTVNDCLLSALVVSDGAANGTPTSMSALFTQDGGDAEGWTQSMTGTTHSGTKTATIGPSQDWAFGLWSIKPTGGGGGGGATYSGCDGTGCF